MGATGALSDMIRRSSASSASTGASSVWTASATAWARIAPSRAGSFGRLTITTSVTSWAEGVAGLGRGAIVFWESAISWLVSCDEMQQRR